MGSASQPLAEERVTRAHHEEGDSGNNEGGIKHGPLLFENVNVFMPA